VFDDAVGVVGFGTAEKAVRSAFAARPQFTQGARLAQASVKLTREADGFIAAENKGRVRGLVGGVQAACKRRAGRRVRGYWKSCGIIVSCVGLVARKRYWWSCVFVCKGMADSELEKMM
jgi:hypothetical protein